MHVYEALAKACHGEGVRTVFNIMGDGNKLWLVSMAAQPGVSLINARHEGAALAMADGYARVSGDVGMCSVTHAAGVTQLSSSLMVAAKRRSPIVIFAADIARSERTMNGQLDIDQRAVVEAAGGVVQEVRTAATAVEDVHLAFYRARTESRPVVLLATPDVQEAEYRGELDALAPLPVPRARIRPDVDRLYEAVELVAGAQRPVILVGRGAIESGARSQVLELADRIGALTATTLQAKGWLDNDPYTLGVAGSLANRRARRHLADADCVIGIGASLNSYTAADGELFPKAKILHIDTRPHALVANRWAPDVYLQGDGAATVDELLEALDTRSDRPRGWRHEDDIRRRCEQDQRQVEISEDPAEIARGTVDPRRLMVALDEVLPDNAIVVVGVGHFTSFPAMYLRNTGDREFHFIFDFICIGQAVPEAIGMALANPDRPVVVFEGDASFMMHVQEIETAARYGASILALVMNDGALGAEYHKLRALGLNPAESVLPAADISAVAEALGASVMSLSDLDDVAQVAKWFDPSAGPHVVDCSVSRNVVGPL